MSVSSQPQDDASSRFVACFAVDSDRRTLHELGAIVGVEGDAGECWERGSSYVVAGRDRTNSFSRWAIAEAGLPADAEVVVERLRVRVELLVPALLGRPADVRLTLGLFLTSPDDVFGLGLSAELVALLGRLGASIEQSCVMIAPPPQP